MRLTSFIASWEGTRVANRSLAMACAAQSVVVCGLLYMLVRQDRTITLVPPEFVNEVSVSRTRADPGYVQSWSYYVATILGNVTPENADFVKQSISPLLCPEVYHAVTVALASQVEQIKLDRVTTRFEPRRIKTEPETGKTFVSGLAVLHSITGADERYERTFEMKMSIANYRPQVCGLESYRGAPKTMDTVKQDRSSAEERG